MFRGFFFFAVLATIALSFSGCASLPPASDDDGAAYLPEDFVWQDVCPGVRRFDFDNPSAPLRYHLVEIDLRTPGLAVAAYPDRGSTQPAPKMSTRDFAAAAGCVAAINTTPFDNHGAGRATLVGVHIVEGEQVSPPEERYAALALAQAPGRLEAAVLPAQEEELIKGYGWVLGGFFALIQGGEKQRFLRSYNSRSGAGISADGTTLYLLAVEGEKQRLSAGLSFPQCADIFLALGCSDAIGFDGGGSADLCVQGASVMSYGVRRAQAASLGFILPR